MKEKRIIHEKFFDIIPEFGFGLILGDLRMGKSALGYALLEELSKRYKKEAYVFGLPEDKLYLLPLHINPINTLDLPEKSIILFDEAYMKFYSKRSWSDTNKLIDTLAGLAGSTWSGAQY